MKVNSIVLALALVASPVLVTHAQPSELVVNQAWARPTVEGQQGGGGFMNVVNSSAKDDKLLRATSPAAERVELHTMSMEGSTMRMREVADIAVKAGQTVALKPGGLHVMFMGIKAPLKVGDKVPVVLEFERAGKIRAEFTVSARSPFVAASAASGKADEHKH